MMSIRLPYKKYHKIKVRVGRYETKRLCLIFGIYGLRALGSTRLTEIQIESMRRTVKKHLKKEGKFWLRVKGDRSVSQKPGEVRMGKGKGSHHHYISVVTSGMILLELGGDDLSDKLARSVLDAVSAKLPILTEIVSYRV